MVDKLVKTLHFDLTPDTNGGEALVCKIQFFDNGDHELYMNQTLELQSYCNSASFNLTSGCLTPQLLRKLADEIEAVYTDFHTCKCCNGEYGETHVCG